ncbi:MAG: hypothetical protein GTO18_05000 [Anaerolineales bacterium]|nr:hypothetical protein [Anaerolineales bacterium]
MDTSTPLQVYVAGAMSHEELQQRVDDWVSGRTSFTDNDRILDEISGEPVRLGLLVNRSPYSVIFVFNNLGFTVVFDRDGVPYVINIVGFEDGQGQRFTFPFHNGVLSDPCAILQLQMLQGRRINQETKISFDQLTPLEFLKRSNDLIDRVNTAITSSDPGGQTGDECIDSVRHYYDSARGLTESLITFLECEACSIVDSPFVMDGWVNTIPREYDPRMPYLPRYDVSYW